MTILCIWFVLSILVLVVSVNMIDINMSEVLILREICTFVSDRLRLLHGTVATK